MAKNFALESGINILNYADWRETGVSPFRIGLRSKPILTPQNSITHSMEVANYSIFSTENLALIEEPLCFSIPDNFALKTWLDLSYSNHQQLISHPLGIKKLTKASITITSSKKLTNAVALLEDNNILTIKKGSSPLLD